MDSSLVAESAMRQGRLSQAYFIDFEERTYSEYEAAKEVADRLGLPLKKTTLTPEVLKNFFLFVEHADDPMADSSAVNVWTISECASHSNKVILGGDGGDEIFGGYLTYQASQLHHYIISRCPMAVRKAISHVGNWLPTTEKKVTLSYKLRRFQRAAHLPTEHAHFTWNGTWLPEEAASFIQPGAEREIVRHALATLVDRLSLQRMSVLQLQRADLIEYLPNDILTKVDRMSMAHGLETRAPFLSHHLSEWALRRPDREKVTVRETKVLLRALARRIYGNKIADRPKQGFSIPIHEWIRGPLRDTVLDLLSVDSLKKIGIFEPNRIIEVVEDHFSRRKSYGFELWGLIVLIAWYRVRIERPPAPPKHSVLIQRRFVNY
jgi:asparagine synthase (glutamine-hydrolysing)